MVMYIFFLNWPRFCNNSKVLSFPDSIFFSICSQSSPQHWEHYAVEMIRNGQEQLQKSKDLRSMVDSTLLTDGIRDLSAQADKVVVCLRKRIEETDQCRQCFERDLDYILRQITEAEALYESLIKMLRQLDFNLKVVQTRLNNRMSRPRVENCRDECQYG